MSCRIVACHLVDTRSILHFIGTHSPCISFAMVVSAAAAAASAAVPLERIESNGSISPAKESPVAQLDYFMFIIQEMEGDRG